MHACPRCHKDHVIKNGSVNGKPKKQCKACSDQFTRATPRGKPLPTKINALLWYLSGMSMHRIAFLCRVSEQSVLNWLRSFAKEHYEKLEPAGKAVILERDEMWHYVKAKRQKLWIWKALVLESGKLLDWEGNGGPHHGALRQVLGQWQSA
jgi:transposase-like protein